jgi:hypothetical protein
MACQMHNRIPAAGYGKAITADTLFLPLIVNLADADGLDPMTSMGLFHLPSDKMGRADMFGE